MKKVLNFFVGILFVLFFAGYIVTFNDVILLSGKAPTALIASQPKTEKIFAKASYDKKISTESKAVEITYNGKTIFSKTLTLSDMSKKQIEMVGGKRELLQILIGNKENLRNIVNYFYPELYDEVESCVKQYEKKSVDAKAFLKREGDKVTFSYRKEVTGTKVNRLDLFDKIISSEGDVRVELKTEEEKPKVKVDDLKQCSELVACHSTNYFSSPDGRKSNIALAANSIFGLEIVDGEIFSFNSVVGERSEERGYKKAKIISEGKYVEDFGGGVCQVATTIFNALLKAGLDIVESHSHSIPASYVELSKDAMVSYYSDLKMKNVTGYPIFISGYADGDRLTFEIYSKKSDKEILLKSKLIKTIKPPERSIEYGRENKFNLLPGEPFEIERERAGKISELYKEVYIKGELSEIKLIRRDFYPAKAGKYYVYTGEDAE